MRLIFFQYLITIRSLRTLLLEGNCITALPSELGKLSDLTALNLSNNPIETPPKHIIQKGTKVVLQYLRDLLKAEEKGKDDQKSSRTISTLFHLSVIEKNDSIITAGQYDGILQYCVFLLLCSCYTYMYNVHIIEYFHCTLCGS